MKTFIEKNYKIFELFDKQWALVTAGDLNNYKTCPVGWGSFGTAWGRSVVTIYVNPKNYSWESLKDSDVFTVTFFPDQYKNTLRYLGEHSGKDGGKVTKTGLTPVEFCGGVDFEEANLSFACKKIYAGPFEREGLAEEVNRCYTDWEPHWMFVGEVIEAKDQR